MSSTRQIRAYQKFLDGDVVPPPPGLRSDVVTYDPGPRNQLIKSIQTPSGIPHIDLTPVVESHRGDLHIYNDMSFAISPWEAAVFTWVDGRDDERVGRLSFVVGAPADTWDAVLINLPQPERDLVQWVWTSETFLVMDDRKPIFGPIGRIHGAIGGNGTPVNYGFTSMMSFANAPESVRNEVMASAAAETQNFDPAAENALEMWYILKGTWPVMLGLSLLNCRNVETRESARTRAERRREERILAPDANRMTHIVVKPSGKNSRSGGGSGDGYVPLTSVRGHMRHYGNCCPGAHEPHGKLFGQHSGRVWVPQFARGHEDDGQINHHEYEVRTK